MKVFNDIKKNDDSEIAMHSTDISPLLTKPSSVNEFTMEIDLKYPKGCSFCFEGCFEGYTGFKDYNRLKDFLIDSACKTDGTQLPVAIHDEFIIQSNL